MNTEISILFIVAAINAILALFVCFGQKSRSNLTYSIFLIFVSAWALGLTFFYLESDLLLSVYIANTYYVAAAGIPLLFSYFAFSFLNQDFKYTWKNLMISAPFLFLITAFWYNKNFLILKVMFESGQKNVLLDFDHYIVYSLYFLFYVILAYFVLFKKYKNCENKEKKNQLNLIIGGTGVSFLLGMVFNLFLPYFGNYNYIWLGPIFTCLMVISIGYAVTRHHLFNVKVIATQLITFSLWITILVRIFLSTDIVDRLINGVMLLILILFGILLIRSVLKEVTTRERIQALAKDLASANDRLKELDKLKSEFLSIASHQIRAPITAIKGYASLILEGDYGPVTPGIREAVDIIFQSGQGMAIMVDDFLNISRIEQGRMNYDFVVTDFSALVTQVIHELQPTAENKGLVLQWECDRSKNYSTRIDVGKIHQVLINIIDNAMKYTPKGSISVSLTRTGNKITLISKDTGIGISPENLTHLFEKFNRAKNAISTNVSGTGLGLYVVKQMIDAHKGARVWAESEGEGKGATFHIELEAFGK